MHNESVEDLIQRLQELEVVFQQETISRHAREFEQIRKHDIALHPRIKQMQAEDERIVEAISSARSTADALREQTELSTALQSKVRDLRLFD